MANMNDLDMSDAGEMRDGFEPFPPGEYVMYLEESERTPTKANDGEYLKCTFVIKEGDFANRKVWHNFNLWNKSADSVKGAKADWKAICEATVGQPSAPGGNSENLHWKPFIGTVKLTPPTVSKSDGKEYPAKNEMVFKKGSVKSLGEQGTAPVGVAAPTAAAPAQAPISQTNPPVAAAAAAAGAARPAWAKR